MNVIHRHLSLFKKRKNNMSEIQERLRELDAMTAKGEILEALEQFYADTCTFTEVADGSSRPNRAAQHEHLSGFFASLQGFDGATLHSSAVGDEVSHSEWSFNMTAGDGSPIQWNEVLVRRWRDGRVVEEKFYNAAA